MARGRISKEAERAALDLAPYDLDPDLAMPEPVALDDLAYDGEVPADVVELARLRRAAR